MKILICNVGSTSLKYRLFDMANGERTLAAGKMERVGAPCGSFSYTGTDGVAHAGERAFPDYAAAIRLMLDTLVPDALASLSMLSCVGFKVVQGGKFSGVQRLTEEVLSEMERMCCVAPAHNPPYIAAVRQFAALLPDTPLIGSFETGFHKTIPPEAYLYSIPRAVSEAHGIRRCGFHGASLQYASERAAALYGTKRMRLIACHLGGSGSVCAIVNGQSVDTNLGLSLQCGVMHNNRIGDIDPYIIFYLTEACGYTLSAVKTMFEKQSGMLGMSGVSNDLRDVELAAQDGNAWAKDALNSYCYAVKKQIGAYAAAMGGVDAVAFTGGIGENSASVRRAALSGLSFLGVTLDEDKNERCRCDCDVSTADSPARIYVIAANEEIIVARNAAAYLKNPAER